MFARNYKTNYLDMQKKELNLDEIKRKLGIVAAELVKPDMIVGLGSGSTASYFIKALIQRSHKEKLNISVVASSKQSEKIATLGGLKVLDDTQFSQLDLVVDGADEIDPFHRMIKGKGGAITREKILAQSTKRLVIIADESKLVSILGNCFLPVEILPFGSTSIQKKMQQQDYQGHLRKDKQGNIFITDNGNYIFDITSPNLFPNPKTDEETLLKISGVVETGFLLQKAEILIGSAKEVRILKETKVE